MASIPVGTRVLCGVAAAAVTLGVSALVAVPLGASADPRAAVGSTIIDRTPGAVKEWAIQTFGTADKLFLTVAVLVAIAILAALAGVLERRRIPIGSIMFTAATVAGCVAILSRAGARPLDMVPTVVGGLAGIIALRFLTSGRLQDGSAHESAAADPGRRLSLAALGLLGLGVLGSAVGSAWARRVHSAAGDRQAYTPPPVAEPAPPIPPEVQPAGVDVTTFVTDNDDFYRIDTALSVPQLNRDAWALRIHGMVDREVTYTFADLEKFELIEKVVTLACVSNPVGGDLIGNAVWTGYRVRDLLAAAGVHPDADMVLSTSSDGFTAGTPTEAMTDDRDSLLAITMNGQPLPIEHGYPARLVVPGLYGYVSATKWVVDLELTRFDRAQGYWTPLGWSERGPIKTQSRIDVPRIGQDVAPGPVRFGGVAWAQHRGVRGVEVRVDDGPWQQATLGAAYSNDTWRLWSFEWKAEKPGLHRITVRATDNTGAVQTEDIAGVVPDGATGWPSVEFAVT
ncbi:molybdopterin-dependent oxidoreductase [Arthrobacter sp. SLBN-53]|uniref:molybdopterin-dependent oxidoreductase n=1 Tax=Arthrobacter sp. SLBN-53 TaxID=2768412 RepID=UPI00114FAD19|nr:molybdopterin-dependent oxidoreductase [Arthrobacter sp. SLBN-53]TQK31358.1 DMSO/TMAO reductase YedYZ molybdopterin-dependent catalytic subunit [Arthrobacter sp. SLBN-53]